MFISLDTVFRPSQQSLYVKLWTEHEMRHGRILKAVVKSFHMETATLQGVWRRAKMHSFSKEKQGPAHRGLVGVWNTQSWASIATMKPGYDDAEYDFN